MKIQIEACYIDHHHDIGSKVYLKLCLHLVFWDMSQFRIRVLIKVSICVSGHELGFKSKVGNQLQWGGAHDHIKGRLRSGVVSLGAQLISSCVSTWCCEFGTGKLWAPLVPICVNGELWVLLVPTWVTDVGSGSVQGGSEQGRAVEWASVVEQGCG